MKIASFSVTQPATAQADESPVIFHALIPTTTISIANPIATDLRGQLVWYYDTLHSGLRHVWPLHILTGGTVLLTGRDAYRGGDDVLREVDLARTPVRETSIDAVNVQLVSRGQLGQLEIAGCAGTYRRAGSDTIMKSVSRPFSASLNTRHVHARG